MILEEPEETKSKGEHCAVDKAVEDLEIKDAQIIFNNVWTELESTLGRRTCVF